jgi:hypothetical protein
MTMPSEMINPFCEEGKTMVQGIRIQQWVQDRLGRTMGKLQLYVITDDGTDYVYSSDADKAGIRMCCEKLEGLGKKYPEFAKDWDCLFITKLLTSEYWKPDKRGEYRFVFGCCVAKDGMTMKGKKYMTQGQYLCYFECQDGSMGR